MIKTPAAHRLSVLAVCLFAALPLAPAALAAQPGGCQGEGVKIVTVTVSGENHAITASPTSVTIDMKGRVCWEISGMEAGQEMVMSGKAASDDQFPERSVNAPKNTINSGAPNKAGTFHYNLILRAKGKEISRLDPTVIVEPPPTP